MAYPMGPEREQLKIVSVVQGNLMLARTILTLMVAHVRGVGWILEQPLGSLFFAAALFQQFLNWIGGWAWTAVVQLKDYGAESMKPLRSLYSV